MSTLRHTDNGLRARVPFKLSLPSSRDETLSVYDHCLIELRQQVEAAGFHTVDSGCHFWCDCPHGRQSIPISIYVPVGGGRRLKSSSFPECLCLIYIDKMIQIISISSKEKKKPCPTQPMLRLSLKQGAKLRTLLL